MSEWEEYWDEANTSQGWSEVAIRDLVKGSVEDEVTEYHWKYVAPLQEQLEKLGHKPSKANEYAFYPKIKNGKFKYDTDKKISKYHTFFTVLGMLLYQEGYIEKGKHSIFINSFDGKGNPEPYDKIEWKGAKNHCTYLIDCLIDEKIILDKKRDKNAEYIFGIKNPAQIRQAYWSNKNQKPKGHQVIDRMIEVASKENEYIYDTMNDPAWDKTVEEYRKKKNK
jgi:hypothetical protein